MPSARVAPVWLVLAASLGAQSTGTNAPAYSAGSIVNSATNLPTGFAPNTIVSLYGDNLAYSTAGIAPGATTLPRTLGGVTVYFGLEFANLYYVSPRQINLLIPNDLAPGPVNIKIVREGVSGPAITMVLDETAPGMFQLNPTTIVATHADGSLITPDAPAAPGEIIVIYAVGLGRTVPDLLPGQIATRAQPIQHLKDMQVQLNGNALDASMVLYAGTTPGFAGLYQVNVRLPGELAGNPEVRIQIAGEISPAGYKLCTP
jgi:uncharacterized protein (TIGR03437 family)